MEDIFLKRKGFFKDRSDLSIQRHLKIRDAIVWLSSSGKSHFIVKMDINYIRNCVNKIERGDFGPEKSAMLPILKNELDYRQILKDEERRDSI